MDPRKKASKSPPRCNATRGPAPKLPSGKAIRRDDPNRRRTRTFRVGSEQDVGCALLNVLRDEGHGHEIVAAEGALWEYNVRGLWAAISDVELHRIVGSFDGSTYRDGKQPKTLRISEWFARGAISRAKIQAAAPSFFVDAAPVLVFANGAVRVTDAGEIELLRHDPKHRARAGYPFQYDPKAKAPRFKQMLREHFERDNDADDKIASLQEFFGACVFGIATRFQKCLALPSDGGGGRSTMLKTIEEGMPAGSVSHVEAKDLRKPERRAKLVGKRLNFSDEVPADAFLESEDFKKIVVGNVVTGEEKYRPSFEFRPIAGLVFPIQISASAELSDAFFRRFNIIRYNRNFEGDAKRDYDLAETISKGELPGVVTWMIEGAARLLKKGSYTIPASHSLEEAKWKLTADTVRAFLDAMYTRAAFNEPRTKGYDPSGRQNGHKIEPHDWTAGSDLYANYRTWCDANGHRKPVANPEFRRRVEKIGYAWVHTHKGNFIGVRPLDNAQKEANEAAKVAGSPPEAVKGAVSVLQGGHRLTIVKNSNAYDTPSEG